MPAPRTCECGTCSKCYGRERARARYRAIAYGTWNPRGDLEAVVAHIRDLRAAGVGTTAIAAAVGTGRAHIQNISKAGTAHISRDLADRILAVQADDARAKLPPYRAERRLRALNRIGWSTRDLGERLGMPQENVSDLLAGKRQYVTRPTMARIVSLYDELHMTPGPNRHSARIATANGYHPPLAWDDIDDPDEDPSANVDPNLLDEVAIARAMTGDRSVALTRPEYLKAVTRLNARGHSDAEIAEKLGKADKTIERARRELGLPGIEQWTISGKTRARNA